MLSTVDGMCVVGEGAPPTGGAPPRGAAPLPAPITLPAEAPPPLCRRTSLRTAPPRLALRCPSGPADEVDPATDRPAATALGEPPSIPDAPPRLIAPFATSPISPKPFSASIWPYSPVISVTFSTTARVCSMPAWRFSDAWPPAAWALVAADCRALCAS